METPSFAIHSMTTSSCVDDSRDAVPLHRHTSLPSEQPRSHRLREALPESSGNPPPRLFHSQLLWRWMGGDVDLLLRPIGGERADYAPSACRRALGLQRLLRETCRKGQRAGERDR